MRKKIWAYKHRCVQCGTCCKNIVCDLGVVLLATTQTPCPALEFNGNKYWCGLVTNTSKYLFPQLELTIEDYIIIREHILKVNNLWEGCDLKRWEIANLTDTPLISKTRANKAVPTHDCSDKKLTQVQKKDIARYILLGAEIQRDTILNPKEHNDYGD